MKRLNSYGDRDETEGAAEKLSGEKCLASERWRYRGYLQPIRHSKVG